eukprot:GHRR01029996.1.p1 GENE.GHRR01029996.1~~GHRR01029996.1.p1  ORF type:complete len:296 (-),score=32.06 GHRR01029996.1:116-1003(-)
MNKFHCSVHQCTRAFAIIGTLAPLALLAICLLFSAMSSLFAGFHISCLKCSYKTVPFRHDYLAGCQHCKPPFLSHCLAWGCSICHHALNANAACIMPNVSHRSIGFITAGAEYCCYTADITRTFPANGTFTPQHRDIYDLVLSLQEHALNLIKPGATWSDIQHSTRQLLLDHLQQLGLVQGSMETLAELQVDKIFMPHGLGHFLGLDVHDVSDVGPVPQQLQEGQCITVEPGVYFMPCCWTEHSVIQRRYVPACHCFVQLASCTVRCQWQGTSVTAAMGVHCTAADPGLNLMLQI